MPLQRYCLNSYHTFKKIVSGVIGGSLDIENYCTLRLLFNQSLVLYKVPEYGKPAKCCSPLHLLFL
ncbi:hypothetical protein CFR00_24130 [Escherichia coli]|nr:hypothetical protein [Escherichia coli]